jgi:hypothetical protein
MKRKSVPSQSSIVPAYVLVAVALALGVAALVTSIVAINKSAAATTTTNSLSGWQEYANDPIYNPYGDAVLDEDYFPYVVYDRSRFFGHGNVSFYKMWHQAGTGQIGLSVSRDGIVWSLAALTNLSQAYHICVLYSANGFDGTSAYAYRAWYWNGVASTTISGIQHAESYDGVTWFNASSVTQDAGQPLVDGATPSFFYHLYGPGFVLYNGAPTNVPGAPMTYRYVMYYDISSEGLGPGDNVESEGVAFSSDGFYWVRYGLVPVLISDGTTSLQSNWAQSHIFRVSVLWDATQLLWHMYYSGSNQLLNGLNYAHGIGHAISREGVTWATDANNPIFYYNNGVAWRSGRSYTPFVLQVVANGTAQMWFSGGSGTVAGVNQSIGYATAPYLIV